MFDDTNISIEEDTASSTAYDTQSQIYHHKSSVSKLGKANKFFLQQKRRNSNHTLKESNEDPSLKKSDNYSTRGQFDFENAHEVSFEEVNNEKDCQSANPELNYYALKKGLSSSSYEYVQFYNALNQN